MHVVSVDFAIMIGDGSRPLYMVLIIDTRLLLRCSGVLALEGAPPKWGRSDLNSIEEGATMMTRNKITIANGCVDYPYGRQERQSQWEGAPLGAPYNGKSLMM
jgi:hypothetical protein